VSTSSRSKEGRIALDEVLDRIPTWEIGTASTHPSTTSTVRGWDAADVV